MKQRNLQQLIGIGSLFLATFIVISFLGIILWDILSKGAGAVSWEFLSDVPRKGMTEGGIFPAIIGTAILTLLTALFSIPLGVAAAVYLSEYADDTWLTRLIRAAIRNLAGVPSIIYGLFGVAIFVQAMSLDTSLIASGLTLGLLTLPYIVTTSEEALRNVPQAFREGSLALGATKWQTIRSVVLPPALPGILTGSILGLSRAAGETAPILFTGVAFYLRYLPTSVYDQFMALPYHLYILSTQHHAIEQVRPLAYGTALVLISLIFLLNLVAFWLRANYRQSY
ncbi:MAG: phosphate ABC transporter permease PstA [Bacteroidota bacterium]